MSCFIQKIRMIYKSKYIILGLFITLFLASSCTKSSCAGGKNGTLKNQEQIGGCDWAIELDDGTRLDPTNLDDFGAPLEEGKKVSVRYREVKNAASICMSGRIVVLKCIKEK